MKNTLRCLTLVLLCHAASSWAVPTLSADGSKLSGVDVSGTLYDVMFGDGVAGNVYAGVTFDAAREAEANAVSSAIVAALNTLGTTPDAINGCEAEAASTFFECFLFNPDSIFFNGTFLDVDAASGISPRSGTTWSLNTGFQWNVVTNIDTAEYRNLTLVRYTPSVAVPAPATLLLFGLGLAGLGLSRRRKA